MTTDGTIGEIPREAYRDPEGKTIRELKDIGKPFLVLVNSARPYGKEASETVKEIQESYQVAAMPVNCEQLKEEDIHRMMEEILFEFPVSEMEFYIPKWVEMLPRSHRIKEEMVSYIRDLMEEKTEIRDFIGGIEQPDDTYIESVRVDHIAVSYTHLGVYAQLLEAGISRSDLIVALGGGVVGDLAGFAAATYLRGIPFVQIPTSLLAQVDSSVGGKVAVDLKEGKNLVGAFYQPKKVLIDPDVLKTLPERYIHDGMGEVIKLSLIHIYPALP